MLSERDRGPGLPTDPCRESSDQTRSSGRIADMLHAVGGELRGGGSKQTRAIAAKSRTRMTKEIQAAQV